MLTRQRARHSSSQSLPVAGHGWPEPWQGMTSPCCAAISGQQSDFADVLAGELAACAIAKPFTSNARATSTLANRRVKGDRKGRKGRFMCIQCVPGLRSPARWMVPKRHLRKHEQPFMMQKIAF